MPAEEFCQEKTRTASCCTRDEGGRVGKPADIAKVVSFLACDDAGWITGQVIPVASGLRA